MPRSARRVNPPALEGPQTVAQGKRAQRSPPREWVAIKLAPSPRRRPFTVSQNLLPWRGEGWGVGQADALASHSTHPAALSRLSGVQRVAGYLFHRDRYVLAK